MNFEKDFLYHIYNRGNNRQQIFFKRENYLFFLRKIKTYISPYADILAWCLLPNHFHLMVYVRDVKLPIESQGFTSSEALTKLRSFNESIGIMLRTYTRAINKQQNSSGSLFRKETKAECINSLNCVTPSFFKEDQITRINIVDPEKQYPQICFNYLHQNPVKAGLVKHETEWEFSSAKDYAGLRNGKLINKERALQYISV